MPRKREYPEMTWDNVHQMCELAKPTPEQLRAYEFAKQFFPLVLFFWREKPGKQRKLKRYASKEMNNYSIIMYMCQSPSMFIGCKRNAKHRGYPHLVAAMHFRDDHQRACDRSNRILSRKFKTWEEVRLIEHREHPDFNDLIIRLKNQYPCTATGQTKMF